MPSPLITQLEPRTGLMWCMVVLGLASLAPAAFAFAAARRRRRSLGRWIGAVMVLVTLVVVPMTAGALLATIRYQVSDSGVAMTSGAQGTAAMAFEDVDQVRLQRIGGFPGLTLIDDDAAPGRREFSLTWATADLEPLIELIEAERRERPTLIAEHDLEHWRESYLSR